MNNQGKNSSSRRNSNNSSGKSVPFKIDGGTMALVEVNNIPSGKWKHCHGIAQSTGQQVNSLKIAEIGLSTIIQDDTGFVSSFDSNEIEVAAKALLQGRGYTVNYQGQNNG